MSLYWAQCIQEKGDCNTCIRRAEAIPGCGTSPSPAISLEVSITTTLLWAASASILEMSLMAVVFPTPGRPSNSIDLPDSTTSAAMFALPAIALPTRQVKPTICPSLLRMQLIRCRHLLIPARLSPPNSPTYFTATHMVTNMVFGDLMRPISKLHFVKVQAIMA